MSAWRNSYGRSKANGRIKSRLTMQGIGHCDLLTEREYKDTHKIPFLLFKFHTCVFFSFPTWFFLLFLLIIPVLLPPPDTPSSRASCPTVRLLLSLLRRIFVLYLLWFVFSPLLNKSLLIFPFLLCCHMPLAIRASLHYIFPMQFSNIKPILQPYLPSYSFYWLLKCHYHIFYLWARQGVDCRASCLSCR